MSGPVRNNLLVLSLVGLSISYPLSGAESLALKIIDMISSYVCTAPSG